MSDDPPICKSNGFPLQRKPTGGRITLNAASIWGISVKMNLFDVNSEADDLSAEEERILASFTRRLIEIAAVAGARGSGISPAAALNAMRLPAIALDEHGFVAEVNAAAEALFDNDFRIKDRRLFVRDPEARALLNAAVDQLKTSPHLNPEPVIVQ